MLAFKERAVDGWDPQGAYFDGSLELLRELAVTIDVDAALPRLSVIVGKMLPHDALRMACFDERGRPVVNASTADVPDMMMSEGEDVIIDDLRTRALGASAVPPATERLVGAGYRSVLGVSTRAPEPLVRVAFWSKRPLAFNRTHVPLARRLAYHLDSVHTAASSAKSRIRSMTTAHRGSTRACNEASTVSRRPRTCRSSASPLNGARCCGRRHRSPRRIPPC